MRRLFLLNGLAILAVVCNHAAHQGFNAMFWWTDRYISGVTIPNYDQIGTFSYYILAIITKLTPISIPAFLFVSGFFIAYTSRGKESHLNWKTVKARMTYLLIPYFIWSFVIFFGNWLESCLDVCHLSPPSVYLANLAFGRAVRAYWYIILIIQLYLLSPVLVPFTKNRWRLSLLVAIVIHIGVLILIYLRVFGVEVPNIFSIVYVPGFFARDLLYFILGIIVGFRFSDVNRWLGNIKWGLLIATIFLGILSVIEGEFIFSLTGDHSRGSHLTIPMTLFAITSILCFLAFNKVDMPYSKTVHQIGSRSYGIYLLHISVIVLVTKIIYHLAPWVLANQLMYLLILIASGIVIPFFLMSFVANSRLRGAYRYLFG